MYRQSILDSLQDIFPGLDWAQLQSLDSGSIAAGMASAYNLDEDDVTPDMFRGLSPSLFEAAKYKTYSPMMESEGDTLLTNLQTTLGGVDVSKAYGGFAGSVGAKKKEKQVRDVYGKGMGDVYSNIRGMQTEALEGISSEVDRWHESAQTIKGY